MAISVKSMDEPVDRPDAKLVRKPRFRFRRWPAGAYWGLCLTAAVVLVAAIGPFVTPNSPLDFIGSPFEPSSDYAWLGTDSLGRDVLSRVMAGGAVILTLSALATALGVLAGGLLGLCAGYVRKADDAIMRLLDVFLAFPQTILALLFVSVVGSSFWLIVALVALIHMPQVARVIRSAALRVASQDFVQFAKAIGTPAPVIIVRELLPNVTGPLLVECGLRFTYSIALISGLSFLGLAQDPPAPNWGLMINEDRIGLMQNPWPVLAPVVLIAILTVGVNLLTDAYARYAADGGAERGGATTPDASDDDADLS